MISWNPSKHSLWSRYKQNKKTNQSLKPSQKNTIIAVIGSFIVIAFFHFVFGGLIMDLAQSVGISNGLYYGLLVFMFFAGVGLIAMILNSSEAFRNIVDKK